VHTWREPTIAGGSLSVPTAGVAEIAKVPHKVIEHSEQNSFVVAASHNLRSCFAESRVRENSVSLLRLQAAWVSMEFQGVSHA
jgi:hypothetical protein